MTDPRVFHAVVILLALGALVVGAALLSWWAEVADADNDD